MAASVRTFSKRSGNFRQLAEELKRQTLSRMVTFAVEVSPVDTAAFVDSFGFNSPQGFDSKDRERKRPGPSTDPGSARQRNQSRLQSEVQGLNLEAPVVFENSAPHAGIVEGRSAVLAQTRLEFRNKAREALQAVKQQ